MAGTACFLIMSGFVGELGAAYGKADFDIKVDDVTLHVKAYVTHRDIERIEVILGQPSLNQGHVAIVVP